MLPEPNDTPDSDTGAGDHEIAQRANPELRHLRDKPETSTRGQVGSVIGSITSERRLSHGGPSPLDQPQRRHPRTQQPNDACPTEPTQGNGDDHDEHQRRRTEPGVSREHRSCGDDGEEPVEATAFVP